MTQVSFVRHLPDGRITAICSCSQSDLAQQPDAIQIPAAGVTEETHYVSGGAVVARQALVATFDKLAILDDGVDEAVLSGLPMPCTVYVDGVANVIADGSMEFSATSPGEYVIRVDEVAFAPQEWRIACG